MAFSQADVAEVSKERHEILHKILQAKVTDSETFHDIFTTVYHQAHGARAAEVVVLADGARWIWNMVEEVLPHAVQILDFSHAKQYLWDAGKLLYGEGSAFVRPWVKEQEQFLLEDKVAAVRAHIERFLDTAPALAAIGHYFQQNRGRIALWHLSPAGLRYRIWRDGERWQTTHGGTHQRSGDALECH